MNLMNPRLLASCALAGLVGACTIEPAYQRPTTPLPTQWSSTAPDEAAALPSAEQWWSGFGDPVLTALQQRAVQNNFDLGIAIDRVMQAQDQVAVAHAAKLPTLGFNGLPTDPVATQLRSTNSGRVDIDSNIFELAFNASYEVDLWGRVRSQEEAARSDLAASVADAGTVRIGLLSSVARAYFGLRALDERLGLDQRRRALAEQRLRLAQLRQDAGRTGSMPVIEARTALGTIEARIADAQRERQLGISVLALLCGELPSALQSQALGAPADLRQHVALQTVPMGLPSTLLERRPDLRAAEAHLHSAHADITVAHAALLPQLVLTARAGYVTGVTRNLANEGSTVLGLGPDISFPLFDGGRLRAELDASRWREDASTLEYRKAILVALDEVERALIEGQSTDDATRRNAAETTEQHEQVRRIASEIEAGRSTQFDAIAAEERLIDLDDEALHLYERRLNVLVALYQALGGGWDASAPSPQRELAAKTDHTGASR